MNPKEHVEKLQAEIIRLRAALKEISELADYEGAGTAVELATQALEEFQP